MGAQRIRLTRYNPGALGRIDSEREVAFAPLYTVRLDKVAWPGGRSGSRRRDDGGTFVDGEPECRYVDLRDYEFERITEAEHKRLSERPAGDKRTRQERSRDHSRAYRERNRAAS